MAIIGHRGGGGGESSEWERLQVPHKHNRGTAVPFTWPAAVISVREEGCCMWSTTEEPEVAFMLKIL